MYIIDRILLHTLLTLLPWRKGKDMIGDRNHWMALGRACNAWLWTGPELGPASESDTNLGLESGQKEDRNRQSLTDT